MTPFIGSTDLIEDGPALAARMRIDGYLFCAACCPPRRSARCNARSVRSPATPAGCAATATRPRPIADPNGFCVDPDPAYLETLRTINRLEAYHRLKHHPALISMFERMLGGPILPHPRVLMRNIFPEREAYTTKAHQDFPMCRGRPRSSPHGSPDRLPDNIGRCRSRAARIRAACTTSTSARARAASRSPIRSKTAGCPVRFAVGDVLIFHSLLVHKGVPNRGEQLRMSMDVRYQLVSEPFNPDNANADGSLWRGTTFMPGGNPTS